MQRPTCAAWISAVGVIYALLLSYSRIEVDAERILFVRPPYGRYGLRWDEITEAQTTGRIVLLNRLLAGDALTASDGRLQGPNLAATPNIAQAGQSVRKLAALDVATIVCYHGGVVQDNAHGQLQRVAAEMAASLALP